MRYFLIVYDRATGQIVGEIKEYGERNEADATRERFRLEAALPTIGDCLEVVVLGAANRAALEKTHARYFKTLAELAAE
ncbi:MAG: hypothetical protein JO265_16945 [Acidimicrobiia bacterium]|nr:hypothetical protein [Acidimicrobiia bacterium]